MVTKERLTGRENQKQGKSKSFWRTLSRGGEGERESGVSFGGKHSNRGKQSKQESLLSVLVLCRGYRTGKLHSSKFKVGVMKLGTC